MMPDAALAAAAQTSPPAPVLQARGVSVVFDGTPIVTDIDFELHAGQVLALVGPNGAGKSTLLSVLAGDIEPVAGTVLLHGENLHSLKLAELARRRAVLLQEQRLAFPFTVTEVVAMGRAPWRGRPEADDDDLVVAQSLEIADVTHLATRFFPTLSGGEKGRASFARVLAQQTRVLMLDEPTAALDIRHQEAVLARARTQAAAGDAVVVVLHDLSLAAAYADEVAVLEAGRLRGHGAPREIFTSALLSEVYRHPIEVFDHPVTGDLIILPVRGTAAPTTPASSLDRSALLGGTTRATA
ncbi:iron complex transport system ATP-binding protein [Sanguibacter gelidistatuariae]|uniref:Iron complex transport system ATP-binding protein n=2 Tax=Sanguibacter gelidistatuariae TaxID=1814289 RepID=A0A1G6VPX0_9MICO|nr:heme ABC transporter ATP-binding protein [Sanguibacter gelidistatuariae]SDD54905.1 iron complex transport system ATP-binding protein [Sanguibacter gelidistatuariae]